jgi:hypothetical protein
VDIDKWPGPALAHITYAGARNFVVWNYDPTGEQIDLLVNTIGPYDGVRPIDFVEGENTARFQVESSAEWTIEVLPITEVRREQVPGTFSGVGDNVVFIDGGTPDLLKANASTAHSNFVVWAYGNDRDLLVNEIAPYTGTVVIRSAPFLLVIEAEGAWTLEVTTR